MTNQRDTNTVRGLCREHAGHGEMLDLGRQAETARYIRSLPPDQRVKVLAGLRRTMQSRRHPPESRAGAALLLGMAESNR